MTILKGKKEIEKWTTVILNPDRKFIERIISEWSSFRKMLIVDAAESIHEGLRAQKHLFISPVSLKKSFSHLSENEKDFWISATSAIPEKLKLLGLYIRPYTDFCRTCILTVTEIEKLAAIDYRSSVKNDTACGSFNTLPDKKKRFFIELNNLIPLQLKNSGFEIIRAAEIAGIDEKMVLKIARAIHSRYQHQIRIQQKTFTNGSNETRDFDGLPEDIRYSNIDNAWHIPAKLLSIGYKIRKVKKGHRPLALSLNNMEIETMAGVEHLRWSWDKRLNGWAWGRSRDKKKKKHPGLIPYYLLPEDEKEKDRELVRLIPALLQDIDFEAYHVNPNMFRKLSYAIKPQSSIHSILEETRQLNDQIRQMVTLTPEVEEIVEIRNRKIADAIKEIEGSYNYAHHIQETFLPEDLYVRECFPESFILFKPKDIVSGDFYYFNRKDDLIILASADCTGHGIPGALLSTIGYGTLDQAVNEAGLTDPAEILKHLFSRIHRFLRRSNGGTGLADDMDIVVCTLNIGNNKLLYSSLNSPFFHLTNGEITELKPNNFREGWVENNACNFDCGNIPLRTGDILYFFSDGFSDQFGGKSHKKYQKTRFMNFLKDISSYPMPEQSDLLNEEIEKWREEKNEDQTDDIMVMGISI